MRATARSKPRYAAVRSLRQYFRMQSLTSTQVATLAALITLFAVVGLAVAVQNQLVDTTKHSPMPAATRRWLWRIELLLRPLALAATGIGIAICLFALRAGEAHPADFRATGGLLTVLFLGLTAHAVARLALPRLWSPASEDHLAPRRRVKEWDWATGSVLVCTLLVSNMPALIYGDRVWTGLLLVGALCAAILAGYRRWMRAARRSTARSRRKRDDELEHVGLRLEPLWLSFEGRHVETLIFRGTFRGIFRGEPEAFIDPDRASELAGDSASTRSFQDARGIDPDGLLEIRTPLVPRPRLLVSVPAGAGGKRELQKSRLDPIDLGPRRKAWLPRRKAWLFRLDNPAHNVLELLERPASDGTHGRDAGRGDRGRALGQAAGQTG